MSSLPSLEDQKAFYNAGYVAKYIVTPLIARYKDTWEQGFLSNLLKRALVCEAVLNYFATQSPRGGDIPPAVLMHVKLTALDVAKVEYTD